MIGQANQNPGSGTEQIARLLHATRQEDPALRAALIKALAARQTPTDIIWLWSVGGLLILAGVALLAVLYLLAQGNPKAPVELAFTAFLGLFGGLLGLLIGAPWR